MGKRLCSLLLAAALAGGMLPAAVAAEDITINDAETEVIASESPAEEEIVIDTDGDTASEVTGETETNQQEAEEPAEQTLDIGEASDPAPVEVVSDITEISDLIQDTWDDSYYAEITVDTQDNQVEKDGETTSLRSELDLTKSEERTVLSSASKAESFFEEETEIGRASCRERV